ncbi:MAG: DUF3604 domain-containing protein [Planctomycetota bacterium]|jgi:hypothetical protein
MKASGILNAVLVALMVLVPVTAPLAGQDFSPKEDIEGVFSKRNYSPYAGRGISDKVFWGDTHLHTFLSLDAALFGVTMGPEDAYRFALGEEVTCATGQRVRLSRPLDFLVVSDHSEGLGFIPRLIGGDPQIMEYEHGKRWRSMIKAGGEQGVKAALELIDMYSKGDFPIDLLQNEKAIRSAWDEMIEAADKYNEPGRFTAFIGYEWTSLIEPGNNLHRVVIFRDDGDRAGRIMPFSALDSQDPEDLWKALTAYEEKTGGHVLAIPHNGNLSNGMMFALSRLNGDPITREYAEERIRWEPIYEVTQIKGDGEAHPFLSPDDEFADYETWDVGNLNLSQAKQPEMLQHEYARSALKLGLLLESKVGVNPYKFGMIGSTDSHTALATAAEENFFGKHSGTEPNAGRIDHPAMTFGDLVIMGWEQASSGYAAVWAHENTREALFDSMERKEVYATTGSRITVRFFGGWDFEAKDAQTRLPGDIGYQKGVPMGGDLSKAPDGKAPTFLVAARKDPMSGNLDRLQIIKGWIDGRGALHEKIYDVAVSDDREIGADGRCKTPVGNTVDVKNATWTNTIGDPELITVWKDPDFNPAFRAFYYLRVLEIPTPRWTAYDAKFYGLEVGPEVRMTTQERAYTSPIWYSP